MEFNFSMNKIIPISASAIAIFFMASLSTSALADNKAALKDAIANEGQVKDAKVVDAKLPAIKLADSKALDSKTKAPVDVDFKKLDVNSDGKISLKEAAKDKALAVQFDAADTNHDGMLSEEEYANYKTIAAVKSSESAPMPAVN